MKRDFDYLRNLLFEMEENCDYDFMSPGGVGGISKDDEKQHYHLLLSADANLIVPLKAGGTVFRLTNLGHDFLDATREDTNWNKTKEIAGKAGAKTIGVMFDVAIGIAKQKITEATGMPLN